MDRPGRSYAVLKDGVITVDCSEGLSHYIIIRHGQPLYNV